MLEGLPPCGAWCSVGFEVASFLARGNFSWRALVDPVGFFRWFGNLFGGRPKLGPDSATDNAALSFMQAVNPVWRTYGGGLRVLEAEGFAISESGGPGRQRLNALTAKLARDLQAQLGPAWRHYFDAGIAFGFSRYCTDGVCTAFRNDPFYREQLAQGWVDDETGMNLHQIRAQLAQCEHSVAVEKAEVAKARAEVVQLRNLEARSQREITVEKRQIRTLEHEVVVLRAQENRCRQSLHVEQERNRTLHNDVLNLRRTEHQLLLTISQQQIALAHETDLYRRCEAQLRREKPSCCQQPGQPGCDHAVGSC